MPPGVHPSPEPGTHLLGPVLAEALARLGRAERARAALGEYLERLGAWGASGATRAGVLAVQALIRLAEGDPRAAAGDAAEAGRLASASGLRLEAARYGLLGAECELRAGRRAAAERGLRTAAARFTELGATAYADLAVSRAEEAGFVLGLPAAPLEVLSPRERAVAVLACRGLTNREIAGRLVVSQKTVEFHLGHVFRRLDVAGRDELRAVVGAI